MFSTLGGGGGGAGVMSTVERYHEYTGGRGGRAPYTGDIKSTLYDTTNMWGVSLSTVERSHQYTGGRSAHRDIKSTLYDTMNNVGSVADKTIEFLWKSRCIEHPPVYS